MLDNKYKFSLVFVWIDQRGKDQAKPEFQPNVTQTLKITGGSAKCKVFFVRNGIVHKYNIYESVRMST